jgi:uncharacterized heparinase superfamily protein
MTDLLVGRYLRTTRMLRPQQVAARVRLRAQRALFARLPGVGESLVRCDPVVGHWPPSFVDVDGRCVPDRPAPAEILAGRLTLLGHTRTLYPAPAGPGGADWTQADAPLLWRFHLHYWDWAWALSTERDTGRAAFGRLYTSWRAATAFGRGVPWSPYVVSVRAWTLCALWHALIRDTPVEASVRADLGRHRAFLRAHLETDVGGNHLIKNLKALIGLAVASSDRPETGRRVDALRREAARQVLPDGGHFERAPAYHCQVLADLDDIAELLSAAGYQVPADLQDTRGRMRDWLTAIVTPTGEVPLLNDGYPVLGRVLAALLPRHPTHGGRPGPAPTARLLAASGLAVLRAGPWHILADVGDACPDGLPAHAHADTLAFLLWHDEVPMLVDTATSTYEPGPNRAAERGTAAHSTVMVDGVDSTEVWGAFRAGRRARPSLVAMGCEPDTTVLTAAHDGYRHLPGRPRHERTWRAQADRVRLVDRVTGSGRHRIDVLFQLAPQAREVGTANAARSAELRVRTGAGTDMVLRAAGAGRWDIRRSHRAAGWNRVVPAATAVYTVDGHLPIETCIDIEAVPARST